MYHFFFDVVTKDHDLDRDVLTSNWHSSLGDEVRI